MKCILGTEMKFTLLLWIPILQQFVLQIESTKLKSYHYNKNSQVDWTFDCLYTTRNNITIPGSLTFCFRYKRLFLGDIWWSRWIPIFLGQVTKNWDYLASGFDYSVWSTMPYLTLYIPGVEELDSIFVQLLDDGKEGIHMMSWRHACIHFDFDAGISKIYENGEKLAEKNFQEFKDWRDDLPDFLINFVSVGCLPGDWGPGVHGGIVTDFNLFGKELSEEEMINWTNCKERFPGDIINWDQEEWSFRRTGKEQDPVFGENEPKINWDTDDNTTLSTSTIEYLDYEYDICDMRNES